MIYAVDSLQSLCSMFTVDYFPFGFFQRLCKRFQHFCFMLWTFLLYFVCTVILRYGFLFYFYFCFVCFNPFQTLQARWNLSETVSLYLPVPIW